MAEVEKDEIVQDEKTGAVLFTPKTKVLRKCTMCFDRITSNQIPACVKACPTGTMVFGERDKILELTQKRVEELKKTYPKDRALNPDEVRVIFVVKDEPKKYYPFAAGK